MRELLEYLRELNTASIALRICLAVLVGGSMGIERGRKNRPAGLRTHILVCLGAAMVMMTNQYVYIQFHASDPVRLGAQVISGIGFLGAGTILVTGKSQIKGLTTAAGLWTAACSGLAIGIGFYEGALLGSVTLLFVVSGLNKLDARIHQRSRYMDVYIEYDKDRNTFSDLLNYAQQKHIQVADIQTGSSGTRGNIHAMGYLLTVKSDIPRSHSEMLEVLTKADGMLYVAEL